MLKTKKLDLAEINATDMAEIEKIPFSSLSYNLAVITPFSFSEEWKPLKILATNKGTT